jgi:UDP-glucose 4-epimerase
MKSLVTGGAGFIGSNLVDRLLALGHEVVVLDNESSDAHNNFYWNEKASNYVVDICDYEKIKPLFRDVDYVFHLAAEARIQPAMQNPILAAKTNVLGTATVLQCAREAGVKRLIYSSTSSAYGHNTIPNKESQLEDCLNPYSVSKVSGEKLCKMYSDLFGLETVILRYFNVYGQREPLRGPYAPVVGIFKRQKNANEALTVVGDGKQKRDFTHVDDVVEANILASTSTIPKNFIGTVFNIGTGVNYSINQIVKMMKHPCVYVEPRIGESRKTLADNSKSKGVLGWSPTIDLKKYIKNLY